MLYLFDKKKKLIVEKKYTIYRNTEIVVYIVTGFLLWINTVLFNFLFIKEYWKKYHSFQKILSRTTVSNTDYKSGY